MRTLAIGIVVCVLALISPAFAQPFADTPTNHWAYDAIAELAAKGLIEGYPDGTFKGDRAMTRYEMAMVVARLLARIESIQIPTPTPAPKPEVTKADIDMILRLVNEFRAELYSQGLTASATWAITPTISVFGNYLTGNNVSNSQTLLEWQAGVIFRFAPNASLLLKYRDLTINGVDQLSLYRAEVNYRF